MKQGKRKFWGIGLVAVVVSTAAPARATTWIVPDEDEMVASADAVVLATVEGDPECRSLR